MCSPNATNTVAFGELASFIRPLIMRYEQRRAQHITEIISQKCWKWKCCHVTSSCSQLGLCFKVRERLLDLVYLGNVERVRLTLSGAVSQQGGGGGATADRQRKRRGGRHRRRQRERKDGQECKGESRKLEKGDCCQGGGMKKTTEKIDGM